MEMTGSNTAALATKGTGFQVSLLAYPLMLFLMCLVVKLF